MRASPGTFCLRDDAELVYLALPFVILYDSVLSLVTYTYPVVPRYPVSAEEKKVSEMGIESWRLPLIQVESWVPALLMMHQP